MQLYFEVVYCSKRLYILPMKKKVILVMLAIIVAIAGFTGYSLFKPYVSNKQDAYFYIKTGDELEAVKENLISGEFIKGNNFALVFPNSGSD